MINTKTSSKETIFKATRLGMGQGFPIAVAGEKLSSRKQDSLGRTRGSLNPGLTAPPWARGGAKARPGRLVTGQAHI